MGGTPARFGKTPVSQLEVVARILSVVDSIRPDAVGGRTVLRTGARKAICCLCRSSTAVVVGGLVVCLFSHMLAGKAVKERLSKRRFRMWSSVLSISESTSGDTTGERGPTCCGCANRFKPGFWTYKPRSGGCSGISPSSRPA